MMKTLLPLFFIITFLNKETQAQQFQKANTASLMTILSGDKHNASDAEKVSADNNAINHNEALKPVGTSLRNKYHYRHSITNDDLPEVVMQTLETRYYTRGFAGQNFQRIELADGTLYYAAELVSEKMDLYVILNESGRVFKAELK